MRPTSHNPASVLRFGRQVAAELAGEALNASADLTMADRLALCAIALAVDLEVSRRAGVEPVGNAREMMADALAEIEGLRSSERNSFGDSPMKRTSDRKRRLGSTFRAVAMRSMIGAQEASTHDDYRV